MSLSFAYDLPLRINDRHLALCRTNVLQSALGDCALNFFVLDNIDPHTVQETIDLIKMVEHPVII